jgi:DNA repair photolyase
MPLNKSSGNMYPFIDYTWNTVKGICPHGCSYCYVKGIANQYSHGVQPTLHFDERELKTNLRGDNFIFIGSSCDLFADDIPSAWIIETLKKADRYNNQYLVQTKNPDRFFPYLTMLPPEKFVLCTTIETNFSFKEMGSAPVPELRSNAMARLPNNYRKMITVEPVMKFDLKALSYLILVCNPTQVNIGADTGGNGLPEPGAKKILDLIEILERHTVVFRKDNLKRLLKEDA